MVALIVHSEPGRVLQVESQLEAEKCGAQQPEFSGVKSLTPYWHDTGAINVIVITE
jgi:hypothetical protein